MSNVLFDTSVETFRTPEVDGVIAYRHGLGSAVVVGDPICARPQMPLLAEAFRAACRDRGWHTIYTVAGESFTAWATQHGYAAIEFAHELVVDPRQDVLAGHSVQRLRGKVHRARSAGVVATEYTGSDEALERELEAAVRRWLEGRKGPQIYLTPFSLFEGRRGKRWFYAKREGAIVGVLQLVRLDAYGGYLISQLVATNDAPPGTTELLGAFALRTLGTDGCAFVTWGPTPLAELGAVTGLSPLSERVARYVFSASARTFHLDRRYEYRRKFPIARTTGSFLLFDPPKIGARDVMAIMRAYHASAR